MTDALLILELEREVYPKHGRNQIGCQEMKTSARKHLCRNRTVAAIAIDVLSFQFDNASSRKMRLLEV
jgi:hypothetical protein